MKTIGSRIRQAREAKRLTQKEVADYFGISRVSVTQWENDTTTPESDKFPGIAKLLGGSAEWYLAGEGNMPISDALKEHLSSTKSQKPSAQPNVSFPPRHQRLGSDRGIPLFGQTVGGPNGKFVLNGQTLDHVFCPPNLLNVDDAYAVRIYGTSMEPRYKAGETIWINPIEPVRAGDDVLVQIVDGDDRPSSYIKEFVSQSSKVLRVRQLNPEEGEDEFLEFPDNKVFSVHKVVFHAKA